MSKNKILTLLTAILFSSQMHAATIKTISSDYSLEAGMVGEVNKTQISSGGFFSAMGRGGIFNWTGTGIIKEGEYKYSESGHVEYTRSSNSLSFYGVAWNNYYEGGSNPLFDLPQTSSFLESTLNWEFTIQGGNTNLTYGFDIGSGTGSSSLYDKTTGEWLLTNGNEGIFKLIAGHQYEFSNIFTTYSRNLEGQFWLTFENATMELPSPASLGIFGLALLGVFGLRKRSKAI